MAGLHMTWLYFIGIMILVGSDTIKKKDVSSFCLRNEYFCGLIHGRSTEYCHIQENIGVDQKIDQYRIGQGETHDKVNVAGAYCDTNEHSNDRNSKNYFTDNIRLQDKNVINNYTNTFKDQTQDEDNEENMEVHSKIVPDIWSTGQTSYLNDVAHIKQQFSEHTLDAKSVEDIAAQPKIIHDNWNKPESHNNEKYIFTPNTDSQMQSFRYVCIEYDVELDQKKVVIYKSQTDEVLHFRMYDLTFTKQDIPQGRILISEYPAYFVVFLGTSSFYHHYEDVVVPTYYMLKHTARLHSSVKSQLYFYHNGLHHGFKQFSTHIFLMELPIRPAYFAIEKAEPNICYMDAAFNLGKYWYEGDPLTINVPKQIARQEVTHVLKEKLHLGEKCSYMNMVVLLNRRSSRMILNSLELMLAARQNGFSSMDIIYFEDLDLLQQAEVISCARIFILVHGAAMIWIPFLPPNSAVIEIGWPQKNWIFYATNMFANDPYLHMFTLQIPTNHLYPDMGYFLMQTPPEKQNMDYFETVLHEWPEEPFSDNPYKFSHCLVEKTEFLEVLKQADQRLRSYRWPS